MSRDERHMITEFLECFSSSGLSFKCAFLLFLVLSSSVGSALDWILQPESCKQRSVGRPLPLFPQGKAKKNPAAAKCTLNSSSAIWHRCPRVQENLGLDVCCESTWEKKASEFRVLFQCCCLFILLFFLPLSSVRPGVFFLFLFQFKRRSACMAASNNKCD